MNLDGVRQLTQLDRRLSALEAREQGIPSGTAFPTGVAATFVYYRTDLGLLCYYDGTRWLTIPEYVHDLPWYQAITLPYTGSGQTVLLTPIRSDEGYYTTRAAAYLFVNTTNNGSNYWTIDLKHNATTIWSVTTAADSAGANILKQSGTLSDVRAAASTFLQVVATKTGTPGSLLIAVSVWYRLIIP